MIVFINLKEESLHLEDFFDIVRDFLKLETNYETQISSNKILFKIFNKKYFHNKQLSQNSYFLKIRSYKTNMQSQICNYTHNYTVMTMTMYYYYINNCYNSI